MLRKSRSRFAAWSTPKACRFRLINHPARPDFDLVAAVPADSPVVLAPGGRGLVPTGLIFELPPGNEAQVRPRSGRTWASLPGGNSKISPVGTSARSPGGRTSGLSAGTAAKRSKSGGFGGLISRQRQAFGVLQAANIDFDFCCMLRRLIRRLPVSASNARRRVRIFGATSALLISGQLSTPALVTTCTLLRSPPMMPVCGDTSFATIQSAPFDFEFLLRVREHVLRFGRKSDDERRRYPAAARSLSECRGFRSSVSAGGVLGVPTS